MTYLVIGATGSIGSLVVEEALRRGHSVRAFVRSAEKARRLPAKAETSIGDLTRPDTLEAAVKDIDAIVFTHGSDGAGESRFGDSRLRRRSERPRSARFAESAHRADDCDRSHEPDRLL